MLTSSESETRLDETPSDQGANLVLNIPVPRDKYHLLHDDRKRSLWLRNWKKMEPSIACRCQRSVITDVGLA